jgi:hypothetical protein
VYTKLTSRLYDKNKRAELSSFVTIVLVLAIGTWAKFDAAFVPFHGGH